MLIFHVGCVWILSIVFGLYNCGIWHRGCSITYTPPYAKKLCQKELCRLLLDYADCNWIVQLYLDCKIVIGLYDCNWIVRLYLDCTIVLGLYNRRICITYTPPPLVPKSCAKNNCVDCSWNMSIVFGLCQLYLDGVDCIWIVTITIGLGQSQSR